MPRMSLIRHMCETLYLTMKKTIQVLIFIFTLTSCHSQEIKVDFENIEINIPGTPGPWIKLNGEYYCYFKTDNDEFSSGSNHQFYILDINGIVNSKIDVPNELQTFYYDLYIRNDTIFTTEYYDHNTFYLDLTTKTWIRTKKGIDIYFDDKDYSVYSLDFGEWGGVTWFKNKQTDKQYEIGATTPIINKLKNEYYLTEGHSILKIAEPKKLNLSKEPYDYQKAVVDDSYHREGYDSNHGAEIMFKYINDDYFNPRFSIATSFISNNKLYHLYKDSIATKIGKIHKNELIPVYTFKTEIHPYKWHYDTRNPIQNNNFQTIQFNTDNENEYGIIEINKNDFKVTYFKNTYQEPVLGEDKMKEWLEKVFDFYYSNFDNLTLEQVDKIEQKLNATNITQRHKISTYLLDGRDVQTPRIFRKLESPELKLNTMYYYTTKEKKIELIQFDWGEHSNQNIEDAMFSILNDNKIEILYKSKFDWISNYIQGKFGKPNSSVSKENSATQKWEMENVRIELEYNKYEVELTMLKK